MSLEICMRLTWPAVLLPNNSLLSFFMLQDFIAKCIYSNKLSVCKVKITALY